MMFFRPNFYTRHINLFSHNQRPAEQTWWCFDWDSVTVYKSGTKAQRTVAVKIFRNHASVAGSVTLRVTGVKGDSEDYGLGKNYVDSDAPNDWVNSGYEDNYRPVTFLAGEMEQTVNLVIQDNPVLDINRKMTLELTGQSDGIVSGGTRSITIIDDRRANLVELSPADNLAAAISAYKGTNTVIKLADGEYQCHGADLGASASGGLSIVGNGPDRTTIKRTNDFYSRVSVDEKILYSAAYAAAEDSKPLAISNLRLDGNQPGCGVYLRWNHAAYPTIADSYYVEWIMLQNVAGIWTNVTERYTVKSVPANDHDVKLGANGTETWNNLLARLEANGYTVYTRTAGNYHYAMVDKGFKWSGSNPTYTGTSEQLYANVPQGSGLVYATKANTTIGRVNLRIEKVTMANNQPSDGLYVVSNVSAKTYYLEEDLTYPTERGALTLVGGYSSLEVNQFIGDYIHVERTTGAGGYNDGNGAFQFNLSFANVNVNNLTINTRISGWNPASTLTGSNVTVNKYYTMNLCYGTALPTAEFMFTNSNFTFLGNHGSSDRIECPGKLIFRNTAFTLKDAAGPGTDTYIVTPVTFQNTPTSQYVKFQGCRFIQNNVTNYTNIYGAAIGLSLANTTLSAIYYEAYDGQLCTFTGGTFNAIQGKLTGDGRGGVIIMTGVNSTNCQYLYHGYYGSSYPFTFELDGTDCVFGHTAGMIFVEQGFANVANFIKVQDAVMTYTQAFINNDTRPWSEGCSRFTASRRDGSSGIMRTIINSPLNTPDGTKQGLKGASGLNVFYDRWKISAAPDSWKHCTAMGSTTVWGDVPPAS